MHWRIKAILQKFLAANRIGDRINHLNASMHRDYYHRGVSYGFNEIYNKLKLIDEIGHRKKAGQNALELGTGYFIVQPVVLKLLGWDHIVTVDISKDLFNRAVRNQIRLLLQDNYLTQIKSYSQLNKYDFDFLVEQLKISTSLDEVLKLCNITYIAPYELNDIDTLNIQFDFIFSQVVLEHIPPDLLKSMFFYFKKWLTDDGIMIHVVNFTDHFANPGFFGDKNIPEFNFLQYSDSYWNFWAGNSIAYTNRLGYPYYFQLCTEYGLTIIKFIKQNYKVKKPFDHAKIHPDIFKKYNEKIQREELTCIQRGTFIISP